MNESEIEKTRAELLSKYPGSHIKVTDDKQEMVAEISDRFAVAVIERSLPHFHIRTRETYRGLRGILYVACEGRGHVLREGETITIEPGQVHFATAAGEPAWIEVKSDPHWSADDHFVF